MRAIFYRIYRLWRTPSAEWEAIACENASVKEIRNSFFFPMVMLLVLAVFMGYSFDYWITMDLSAYEFFSESFKRCVVVFTSYFAGFYLSVVLFNEVVAHYFGLPNQFNNCFRLLAYSAALMLVVKSVVSLMHWLFVFYVLNLYVIYILLESVPILFPKLKREQKSSFVICAALMLYASPILIEKLMMLMMR